MRNKATKDNEELLYKRTGSSRTDHLFLTVQTRGGGEQIFRVDQSKVLGKGGFGEVYVCCPVNFVRGKPVVLESKQFAAKVIRGEKFSQSEVDILKKYYKTYPAIDYRNQKIIITEYLPGKELSDPSTIEQLAKLTFSERTNLMQQILMSFNLIHHNTLSTGSALAHSDIKPQNILVDITSKDNRMTTDTAVLDFGLSEPTKSEHSVTKTQFTKGTYTTQPPEAFRGEYSAGSDVFMISSLLMIVLGASDPYAARKKFISEEMSKIVDERGIILDKKRASEIKYMTSNISFVMNGIMDNIQMPNLGFDLKSPIINFLQRMSALDDDERPGTDDCLRFIICLNKIALSASFAKNDPQSIDEIKLNNYLSVLFSDNGESNQNLDPYCADFFTNMAKIQLMANGLWETMEFDEVNFPLQQIDFESYPKLCAMITEAGQKGELTEELLSDLLLENPQIKEKIESYVNEVKEADRKESEDRQRFSEFRTAYMKEVKSQIAKGTFMPTDSFYTVLLSKRINTIAEVIKAAEKNPLVADVLKRMSEKKITDTKVDLESKKENEQPSSLTNQFKNN